MLPTLVIPTFRGGDYFREAMATVLECEAYFDRIIVSVNGAENAEDLETSRSLDERKGFYKFVTGKDIDAVRHAGFVVDNLERLVSKDSILFFLCHDDLLVKSGIEAQISAGLWEKKADSITFGPYIVFDDTLRNEEHLRTSFNGSLQGRASIGRQEWLNYILKHHAAGFTNVSGTQLPFRCHRDAVRFVNRTNDRRGMRFEYILSTHKSIQKIEQASSACVKIRTHASSEGRNASKDDYAIGELRFVLWLLLNSHSFASKLRLLRSSFGIAYALQNLGSYGYDKSPLTRIAGRSCSRLSSWLYRCGFGDRFEVLVQGESA